MPKASATQAVQLKSCSDITFVDTRLRAAATALAKSAPYANDARVAEALVRVITKTIAAVEKNTTAAPSSVPVETQLERLRAAAMAAATQYIESSFSPSHSRLKRACLCD